MNYYIADRFTLGLGFDYSTSLKRTNISPGFRWYFNDGFFLRGKAYIASDFNYIDVGPGIGHDFFLNDNWAIEANGGLLYQSRVYYFPSRNSPIFII